MGADLGWAALLAATGAVIGSFVGLVTLRLPAGGEVVSGRSRCSACSRTLGVRDLVPLLSFALLRGRCRTCSAPIERRYPLIEAGSVLIGAVSALALPDEQGLAAALLGWALLLLAVLDLEHFWLPDRLTYPLIAAGAVAAASFERPLFLDAILGGFAGFLSFQIIARLYRRIRGRHGMGGGDAKLFAAAGTWLGWYNLPAVLLGASSLALIAALIMHRGKSGFSSLRMPFGAFLAPAIWLLYISGAAAGLR